MKKPEILKPRWQKLGQEKMGGTFDAIAAARTGMMDWSTAEGTIDHIRDRVGEMPDALEVHGDGLLTKKHFHDKKGELLEELNKASEDLDRARQRCYKVLERL